MQTASTSTSTSCTLAFHGAAANSCPHSLLWVRAPSSSSSSSADTNTTSTSIADDNNNNGSSSSPLLEDTIIYASSGVINLASSYNTATHLSTSTSTSTSNTIPSVNSTLVTRTLDHYSQQVATINIGDNNNDNGPAMKKVLARGEAVEDAAAARSITALSWVDSPTGDDKERSGVFGIVAAFSDGTVTSWRYCSTSDSSSNSKKKKKWNEFVLIGHDPSASSSSSSTAIVNLDIDRANLQESIADISAINIDNENNDTVWLVATASSKGIFLHASHVQHDANAETGEENEVEQRSCHDVHSRQISNHAAASVQLQYQKNDTNTNTNTNENECYLFAGSASPRHNKVWVYTIPYYVNGKQQAGGGGGGGTAWVTTTLPQRTITIQEPIYHGHLMGHQDWITCFSWHELTSSTSRRSDESSQGDVTRKESLLASSGHDAKIRLWKFSTWTSSSSASSSSSSSSSISINMASNNIEGGDNNGSDDNDVVSTDEDEDEANIDDLEEEEGEARLIIHHSTQGNNTTSTTTAVSLEALLLGHEENVTSLTWRKQSKKNVGKKQQKPCLLSSSMDRTILLWMEEEDTSTTGSSGVWVPISRVGAAGGILGGSIGASFLGFVDATFSPDDDSTRIVGHGYGGSVHFWTRQSSNSDGSGGGGSLEQQQQSDADGGAMEVVSVGSEDESVEGGNEEKEEEEEEDELMTARWVADPCITGHFRSVEDMAWEPNGEYLLTTSSDQTTRLWTEVPVTPAVCKSNSNKRQGHRWVEVGRPQVHGYDMTSIVCIGGQEQDGDDDSGEPCHRFVSGADEKVLRVFDAPASALRTIQAIKNVRRSPAAAAAEGSMVTETPTAQKNEAWRVERAFLPSLGLSNKATADAVDQETSKFSGPVNDDDYAQTLDTVDEGKKSVELKLPSERDLGVTTLWPETRKLFGHESELVCLAAYRAEKNGASLSTTTLVASSCKARNDVASASIRLWDAKKGSCVGILKGGHRSTVSTMSFSRDGKYLASSGKDRRICIWKRYNTKDSLGYELSAAADSAHKRIVWSVHFCPQRPDILASGSRDGLVKVWIVMEGADGSLEMKEMMRFEPSSKSGKNPVTAVAFADNLIKSSDGRTQYGLLSIGTESGGIEVWCVPMPSENNDPTQNEALSPSLLCSVSSDDGHFDTVKRLSWRPAISAGTGKLNKELVETLASCGQDNGVRIFRVAKPIIT